VWRGGTKIFARGGKATSSSGRLSVLGFVQRGWKEKIKKTAIKIRKKKKKTTGVLGKFISTQPKSERKEVRPRKKAEKSSLGTSRDDTRRTSKGYTL